MAMNQSCFAFRGLGVSQPAVYQIIKRAVRSLKAKANGATFAAINTRDLKIETILVPPDEDLVAFEEEAASLHSMMRANEEESLKLSSLRDVLLPKLMAGEIDVSRVNLTQLNSHLSKCSSGPCYILSVMAALSATKWRISTKQSMMRTLASIAVSLRNTVDSVETPCSVNTRDI